MSEYAPIGRQCGKWERKLVSAPVAAMQQELSIRQASICEMATSTRTIEMMNERITIAVTICSSF